MSNQLSEVFPKSIYQIFNSQCAEIELETQNPRLALYLILIWCINSLVRINLKEYDQWLTCLTKTSIFMHKEATNKYIVVLYEMSITSTLFYKIPFILWYDYLMINLVILLFILCSKSSREYVWPFLRVRKCCCKFKQSSLVLQMFVSIS